MKKMFVIVLASLLSAFVISFVVHKAVDYSNHYQITIQIDYGNGVVRIVPKEVGETYLMERIPDSTRMEGYTFVGWYEDKNFTKEFDFSKPIIHDTTIYAKWEKNT